MLKLVQHGQHLLVIQVDALINLFLLDSRRYQAQSPQLLALVRERDTSNLYPYASAPSEDDVEPMSRLLSSRQVARTAIKGMFKRRPLVVPGLAYQFSLLMMRFLPRSMATSTANYVMRN